MTPSHNIIGSEAFNPRPQLQVSAHRRPKPRLSTILAWYAGAILIGGGVSLIDVVIGAPVCLVAVLILFAVLWLRA